MKTRSLVPALAAFLLAALPPLTADQPGPKIDSELRELLSASPDAVAPFVVFFRDKADVKTAAKGKPKAQKNAAVVASLKAAAERSQGGVVQILRRAGIEFTSFWVNNSLLVPDGTLELAEQLARNPKVGRISLDETVENPDPIPEADASTNTLTYGLAMINADDVWALGHRGQGSVVANIDTGVAYTHSALVHQYRGNTGSGFSHAGNWADPTSVCGSAPCDDNDHGTHTMGTMVGDDGAGEQIGVAPEAEWIACKGCAGTSCSGSALASCAQWVLDPLSNGGVSGAPDVVNNSWGGSASSWYLPYVESWRAAGVFPAFSNGNSGPSCGTTGSPGNYVESFAAGAVSSGGSVASFSSRGPSPFSSALKPNVAAPGVSVRSSVRSGGYGSFSGTSMASPHVAGAVALLWEARPELRGQVACTATILQQTADKVLTDTSCGGDSVADNVYGYGLLDVLDAVALGSCGESNTPPTVSIHSPDHLSQFDCGTLVSFGGAASDDQDGDLSSSIEWADEGVAFGTGGSPAKSFDCDGDLGWHTITAFVADSSQVSDSDSISIEIINPDALVAPTDLTASTTNMEVTLGWTDANSAELGYAVERVKDCRGNEKRKTPELCSWGPVGQVAANASTFTETPPAEGRYDYRVFAFTSDENGPYSSTVRVDVSSADDSDSGGGGVCRGNSKKCR